MKSNLTGIVLLAAGASVRMGEAKQMLEFRAKTLLRRSVETALKVSDKIVVTLGARSDILRTEIEDLPVQIAENKDWETGMGSSIKLGLERLIEANDNLQNVIILVCDQPFVNADLLQKLVAEFERTDAPVVACEYEKTLGVPALFSIELFPELLALAPENGAKTLIKKYSAETVATPFPEGAFDIDTPEDYEKLLNAETRTK